MSDADDTLANIDDVLDDYLTTWDESVSPDAVRYIPDPDADQVAELEARAERRSGDELLFALLQQIAEAYGREFDQQLEQIRRTTHTAATAIRLHVTEPERPRISLIPAPMTHHPRWDRDADPIRRALDNPNAHTIVVPKYDQTPAAMFASNDEIAPSATFQTEILTRHRFADQDTTWLAYLANDGSHVAGPARPRPDR